MIEQIDDSEHPRPFVAIATIADGLTRICERHSIKLIDSRDDLDRYRFACVNINSTICILENYPRYYPESFDLCLEAGTENARHLAEKALLALDVSLERVRFCESAFYSYLK